MATLRVWGEYDSEFFEYEYPVPEGLETGIYWLIAQGLMFRNGWSDEGTEWYVSLDGEELT